MTKRATILQSDADRIAKAAAKANVKAEIRLKDGTTVVFSPVDPVDSSKIKAAPKKDYVL